MNQKDKTIKFKKTVNDANSTQTKDPQREKIIKKLTKKFDITPKEAEKIFIKLEQEKQISLTGNNSKKQDSIKDSQNNNIKANKSTSLQDKNSTKSSDKQTKDKKSTLKLQSRDNVEVITPQHQSDKDNTENTQKTENKKPQQKQQDVDDILTGIIPNYQQQVSIELNHVDLTFNVEKEKVETIKEKFINAVKRKKSDKLTIHALNDISFKIYQGEKIGVIGYNGSGKSTLLKIISGIYAPDSGEVNVKGMVSPLLSLGSGFDKNYTGRKNIILNGAILGYERSFLESKMNEIIEFSELGDYIDLPIKNYSSGMLAKLGFSVATIVNPDILIIDEILAVGDITFKRKSGAKLRSLIDSGTTLILVSHSIPQIRELCDKAIWIDNGKIREIGEVNKVCENYIKDAEKASNEQLANIKFR